VATWCKTLLSIFRCFSVWLSARWPCLCPQPCVNNVVCTPACRGERRGTHGCHKDFVAIMRSDLVNSKLSLSAWVLSRTQIVVSLRKYNLSLRQELRKTGCGVHVTWHSLSHLWYPAIGQPLSKIVRLSVTGFVCRPRLSRGRSAFLDTLMHFPRSSTLCTRSRS
jgi:hypothetical protein